MKRNLTRSTKISLLTWKTRKSENLLLTKISLFLVNIIDKVWSFDPSTPDLATI